jgi:short-subunit dehydrogenase
MENSSAVETQERLRPAIVVTGASSGIGREFARIAACEGHFMLLVARSRDALEALAAELSARGAVCAVLPLDLGKPEGADAIEQALARRGLYCDVLVNSAGFGLFGPASLIDPREQIGVLDVNARALTELTLRFLPGMVERDRGGILNVGSMTGYAPGPNMAVYYATKAYVHSFTTALALETGGRGVTVTSLTPGFVRTGFFARCQIGHTRISKLYPRMDAAEVARIGWKGFKQGKSRVVPGLANRVVATLARLTPEAGVGRLVRLLQR